MIKLFCSITAYMLGWLITDQEPINYSPKSLNKAIEKIWDIKESQQLEIEIADSLSKKYRVKGKYFKIVDNRNESQNRYIYIGRVNSCRAGGCSVSSNSQEDTGSEYFDYFVLFNENLEVDLVKIYNYQATHGQEVTIKGWLKQFIGYSGAKELAVGKNVDAIAGATISVYAITTDIELKTKLLGQLEK